jgi:hypothetical protein
MSTEDALRRQMYQKLILPHEADIPSSVQEELQTVCSGNRQAYFASLHAVIALLRNLSCSPVVVPWTYVPGTVYMGITKNSPIPGTLQVQVSTLYTDNPTCD